MKLSAKPISSPGRTDKFPPPLMRFLRSNVGSRSRGRSRSSTMFVRKKSTAIETQEPTSPKVTCMGQVRVRRSSKQASAVKRGRAATRDGGAPTRCHCLWIRKNALFRMKPNCNNNSNNLCRCQPVWPKWGFFRVGSFRRKSTKLKEDSAKSESNFHETEHEENESEYEERVNVGNAFASNSCTPPRNALLLTRSRSAPYRSSSLASRFWGSPLRRGEETVMENRESRESSYDENKKPSSLRNSVSDEEGERVLETETKLRFFKELEDSLRDKITSITKSESVEELKKREKGEGDCEARPVVLTRCKSEPARTGYKLDPEVNNFWKKRKLGFADTFD